MGDSSSSAVFLALARHGRDGNYGFMCWPSLTRLTKITGLGTRTVILKLKKLEAAGIIKRIDGRKFGYLSKVTIIDLDLCKRK